MELMQTATVGPRGQFDNDQTVLRAGKTGELIVQGLYGKYAELAVRGKVFAARTAAALAIPVHTTLTNSPTLWNPTSSGKLLYPLKILLSPAAIGTPVLQGFGLGFLRNTGDTVAVGLPLATFTNVAPVCTLLNGAACVAQFAGAVVTFTTQPAVIMDLGFGHWIEGAAASGGSAYLGFDLDGTLIMPPGTSITLASLTTATSTTYWVTMLFAEVPLPAGWA
jgi:hypothetical protein